MALHQVGLHNASDIVDDPLWETDFEQLNRRNEVTEDSILERLLQFMSPKLELVKEGPVHIRTKVLDDLMIVA